MSLPPEDVAPSTAAGAAPEDPSPDGATPATPGDGSRPSSAPGAEPASSPSSATAFDFDQFPTDRPEHGLRHADAMPGRAASDAPAEVPELPPELLALAEKLRGTGERPGALGACLNAGTPFTKLLAALLIGVFLFLASSSDWRTEDFWKRSFGDVTFSLTRLEDAGSLTPLTLHEMPQLTRLVSALALHPGPWSLILSLMMLFGAGRFVERFGGSVQVLTISLIGGIVGNALALLGNEHFDAMLVPCGFWSAGFALVGAQFAHSSRGPLADSGLQVQRPTGLLSMLFYVWLIGMLHFAERAVDIRSLAPYAGALLATAFVGYLIARQLPARLEQPAGDRAVPELAAGVALLFLLPILASGLLLMAQLQAGPGPSGAFREASAPTLETLDIPKLEASVELPPGYSEVSIKDSTGRWSNGYVNVILFSRPRQEFDAPDTLVGRFMNILLEDMKLRSSDLTILDDRPFEHPSLEAHMSIYAIPNKGLFGSGRTLQRVYYFVGSERSMLMMVMGSSDDVSDPTWDAVARSLRVKPS